MIIVNPEGFESVETQLRMIRESREKLIESMTLDEPAGVFANLCASVLALHQVVEQMLVAYLDAPETE